MDDIGRKLTGHQAIKYAEKNGCYLCLYTGPTEDDRDDLSTSEARRVAAEDPSLIYIWAPRSSRYEESPPPGYEQPEPLLWDDL